MGGSNVWAWLDTGWHFDLAVALPVAVALVVVVWPWIKRHFGALADGEVLEAEPEPEWEYVPDLVLSGGEVVDFKVYDQERDTGDLQLAYYETLNRRARERG